MKKLLNKGKLIKLTNLLNFSQKFEFFDQFLYIDIKCEFCERIRIDFKNREFTLYFYKEHKKYFYEINISKKLLIIRRNVKSNRPDILLKYINDYEKTIDL